MARIFDRVMAEPWLQDEMVQKFPRGSAGDIRLGSPCIVNPGEMAVFVRSGKSLGTFEPGTHILTTANVPWLSGLIEDKLFGGKTVFTADVYFIKATDMTFKWGTSAPILVEHPNRAPGASAIVGNGTYVAKVKEPWRFLSAMDAFRETVRLPQLKQRLDPMLGVMMQDKMSELAIAKELGPAQLQSFSQDLNDLLVGLLQPEFDAIGMVLVDFNIRMGIHPESLAVVTKMGYGTSYSQMQISDAAIEAAKNPSGGGGSLAEVGIGMMGINSFQQQQQQIQQQANNPQMQQMQQQMQQLQDQLKNMAAGTMATPDAAPEAAPVVAATEAAAPAAAGGMPSVMTPAQAAVVLQVSEADVLAIVESGELKARKIGSSVRISAANLNEFLNG